MPNVTLPVAVLWGIWNVWLVSWIVAARWSSAVAVMQSARDRFVQSVLIVAGAILIFVKPAALGAAAWLSWTGIALALAGLTFTWWARIHLGCDWSAAVTLKENHRLVRSGPYAITRHPIYTGLVLALWGSVMVNATVQALVGFALAAIGFVLKLRQEERFMTGRFGDAYRDYKARVRALVPGVW
jgi:protein-S-isoprenylcysteine O-methyltransferase Ste14